LPGPYCGEIGGGGGALKDDRMAGVRVTPISGISLSVASATGGCVYCGGFTDVGLGSAADVKEGDGGGADCSGVPGGAGAALVGAGGAPADVPGGSIVGSTVSVPPARMRWTTPHAADASTTATTSTAIAPLRRDRWSCGRGKSGGAIRPGAGTGTAGGGGWSGTESRDSANAVSNA
jgi:hypothetical protein